jgi:hypothetical protein
MSDYLNFLSENQTYNDLNDYASQAQQTYKDVSEQIKDTKLEGLIMGMPEITKLVTSGAKVVSKGLNAYDSFLDTIKNPAEQIVETVSKNVSSGLSNAISRGSNYVRNVGKSLSDRLNTQSFETDPEDFIGGDVTNDMGLVDRFQSVFRGGVQQAAGAVEGGVQQATGALQGGVQQVAGAVEGGVAQATGAAEGGVQQAAGAAEGGVQLVAGVAEGGVQQAIEGGVQQVAGVVRGGVQQAAGAIEGGITQGSKAVAGAGEAIGESIGEVAGASIADVIPVVGEIALASLAIYDIFKGSHIADPISYAYSAPSFVAGV